MDSTSDADTPLQRRVRQQEVVADLSQQALQTDDIDRLLHEATAAVATTLEAEYVALLESRSGGDELYLRHGVGWRDGLVGSATVPVESDSQIGETLSAEDPTVVTDLQTEGRSSGLELLTTCDVDSGISTVVGPVGNPWGVLGVHTTENREFTQEDVNFAQRVASVLATAIENHRARHELEEMHGRISDGFFALNENWEFTYLNERAHELINPENRELVGKNVWDVFSKAVDREFKPTYEHAMFDQESVSFEEYYPEPLDSWFEVHAYPSETGLSVYFRDVTERRAREQELERQERRFEAIFDDPNILVGLLEPDGTVLDINRTAMEYTEADLEDVTGEPFWETPWWGESDGGERSSADSRCSSAGVQPEVREWVERAADGEYVDFEADLTRPNSEVYSLSGVFRPVTNDEGEVVSLVVSGRDVTERKQHERELEEAQRRYQTLVEHFPNGAVALVDEELNYVTFGGTPEGETDVTRADLEGEPLREALPSELEDVVVPHYEAALEGETRTFERAIDDNVYQFHFVPVRDGNGDVVAAMGMSQDVTERVEAQRGLEESEQRYRTLVEHFPNGIVTLFDHDLEYTLAAGQAFEDLPVDPDDLEGCQLREAWPDEIAAALEPALEAALDGEVESVNVEYASSEWVVHAVPITDERGDVFAGMTMAQDVTEQKERERYLRDAKAQLEAATEAGAVGTWEWQIPEDRFVTGASFARKFGVDPEDARGGVSLERMVSSIHVADRDRVQAKIEEAVETCSEYEAEYRVWNADGELRWVVARGHVECDDEGNPETFPGALTDITERKRAEIEAEKRRKELETLFEVLPVGVVVANGDGSLRRANDTAKEIWGGNVFDAESVEEYEKYSAVWADSGEPVEPEEWTMSQVLRGEAVTEPNVYEIRTFDDEKRIIMEHGMPVRDEHGEVSRAVVTLTDITERKEYQRKLKESNERLEQFAYAASHDLQEPLRMVSSYLQLIEQRYADDLDDDGEEFIEFAVDGAERMSNMIDGLLEYSRVEAQGDPFDTVDLDAVLDDVLADLQLRIEETDAEITTEPLPRVEGDAEQLRQVFQNLLSNAIEYSGDGPPRIHVETERTGSKWRVSVRDEGIGIDPDDQDRVFEVFQRLHSQDEGSGTGIGLALTRRIVERHGGEIRVDSEPGEGATFSFTLPEATEE
ncbi:PAS domain-containing sensor histidine kinase [Natronococcus pandeyae]|uniref:histidine kinase n=1 Tax=Natronococcus pandeyae TaxID=2055836 RepID=A0A8J8Q7S4_9EURY|nr:PAS domain-containing protein [Natronococcus pandeyae]TYL40422.1 PAS domain-containing sensor histidine kinase [Natronococcus pandeyae]